jgi:lipopolysaccharide/colanic/teichoic acid biosynthesis glycosyltransferase
MARRLFDLAAALIGLTLLLVPGLIVCLLIKATSRGPIFYFQRRVGFRGRPFWLCKFRTMRADADGAAVTTQRDPRITPIGHFMRRWKIDETPQFWNILKGEMSVIGPRPEMEKFVRFYTPEERRLLEEKPGLAFVAVLVYPHEAELLRAHPDPEKAYVEQLMPRKLAADLAYQKDRTFLSDMRLMGEVLLMMAGVRKRMDRDFVLEGTGITHP